MQLESEEESLAYASLGEVTFTNYQIPLQIAALSDYLKAIHTNTFSYRHLAGGGIALRLPFSFCPSLEEIPLFCFFIAICMDSLLSKGLLFSNFGRTEKHRFAYVHR